MAKRRHATMARFEGAATGIGGIFTVIPDLVGLAWIQTQLVFFVAAAYGFDPHDPMRPAELLVLMDLYETPQTARAALDGIGKTMVEAYIGSRDRARRGARRAAGQDGRQAHAAALRRPADPRDRDGVQRGRQRARHARARRPGDQFYGG